MAAQQHQGKVKATLLHRAEQPSPAHQGHHEVAQHQRDLVRMQRQDIQRLLAIGRLKHAILQLFQHRHQCGPHGGLILDHQDRLAMSWRHLSDTLIEDLDWFLRQRGEVNEEGRPLANVRLHVDVPTVQADDAVDLWQS